MEAAWKASCAHGGPGAPLAMSLRCLHAIGHMHNRKEGQGENEICSGVGGVGKGRDLESGSDQLRARREICVGHGEMEKPEGGFAVETSR